MPGPRNCCSCRVSCPLAFRSLRSAVKIRESVDLREFVDCQDLEDAVESPVFVRLSSPDLSEDADPLAKLFQEAIRGRLTAEFVRLILGEDPPDLEPSSRI